jgi:nitrate/nitrite transport system permease protein
MKQLEISRPFPGRGVRVGLPGLPGAAGLRLGRAFQTAMELLAGLAALVALWMVCALVVGRDLPTPAATAQVLTQLLADPLYDRGPNDKGILIQLGSSLGRVFAGFALGSLVAVPIGLLMGSSPRMMRIINPVVQVLRPVSPLAWFPIGLAVMKGAGAATIFVIFVTALWPTVINTAFGVASVPQDYHNVARVFRFSRWRYLRVVLVPFALPYIVTGLRLSMGVAWMVIVAAEMLSGGIGIGFFVWDSWNALSLERVISAIVVIGLTGLLLDRLFDLVAKRVAYDG